VLTLQSIIGTLFWITQKPEATRLSLFPKPNEISKKTLVDFTKNLPPFVTLSFADQTSSVPKVFFFGFFKLWPLF
jgi:hypothetical protein